MEAECKLSIREFFSKDKYFYVPTYQRGYKWGVPVSEKPEECAVSILLNDIKNAIDQDEYFIQGVTVAEEDENIILIDGQQRITTFFLILLILLTDDADDRKTFLFKDGNSKLNYAIRHDSQKYINSLLGLMEYSEDVNKYQDTFYLQKCIVTVKLNIKEDEKETIKSFILEKVKLFYISVDKDKAPLIFNMLNGIKAFMALEELVKADLLNKSSRSMSDGKETNILSEEWEINQLRGRYAREWDRWMYFWNREDVRKFYNSGSAPMGLLIEYFFKGILEEKNNKIIYHSDKENVPAQFRIFQKNFLSDSVKAKNTFLNLRKLQKRFEDLYENPLSYNYLGMTLKCSGIDYFTILRFFLNNYKNIKEQKRYCYYSLAGVTDKEIIDNKDSIFEKIEDMVNRLNEPYVYWDQNNNEFSDGRKQDAFKQLLRLNVEEDNKLNNQQGRKFFFNAWTEKSLEHIHPKSKVYWIKDEKRVVCVNNLPCEDDKGFICRDNMIKEKTTEHSLGNLVLLYKDNNSSFSDKSFEEKKAIYFGLAEAGFKSRSLLHSISVFSKSIWNENAIKENQKDIIDRIKKDYGYEDGKWKTL